MTGELSALERERQARILANQQRMKECGLLAAVQVIATTQTTAAAERRAKARASKAAHRAARAADSTRRVRRWVESAGGVGGPVGGTGRALAHAIQRW